MSKHDIAYLKGLETILSEGVDVLQKYGITNVSGKDINQLMYGLERMYSDHNMRIDTGSNGKPVAVPKAPVQNTNIIPSKPSPTVDNRLNIETNMKNPMNKDPDAPAIDLSTLPGSKIDFSKFPSI